MNVFLAFPSKYVYYSHDWLLECKNVWNLKTILLGAVNNNNKKTDDFFLHINCMPNSLSNTHFLPYRLRAIIRFECIRTALRTAKQRPSVYISHCIYKLYTLRTQASVCQCIRVTFDGRWLCVGSIFWSSFVHILHTKHLSSGFWKIHLFIFGYFFVVAVFFVCSVWTTFKKLQHFYPIFVFLWELCSSIPIAMTNRSKYIRQMFYSILDIRERFSPSVSVLVSFILVRFAVQFVAQMIRPISKQKLYE